MERTVRLLTDLDGLSDDSVMELARRGVAQAFDVLMSRYREMVRKKVRSYFLVGADEDDLVQEGMIGLFKAVRDYRRDRCDSFPAFADLCITRQIITAVKTASRLKHKPLNTYISLNRPVCLEEYPDRVLMDLLSESYMRDPVELVIGREEMERILRCVRNELSRLEAEVLGLYLDGNSYQDIAAVLGCRVKSVDNALQRVKRKIGFFMRAASSA
ncbi:MAG: RNA polymerase sporulation sigma factor SigH [Actinomycetota bacterium]|nr:RNA polymerase sporulation sigma factor SigH [Actinomycetota bacterium]